MERKKRIIGLLLVIILISVLCGGCYPFRRPLTPEPLPAPPPAPAVPETPSPGATEGTMDTQKYQAAIVKIEGVKGATVVIVTNTVLVGVDLPPNTSNARTEAIKTEVVKQVKAINPAVTNVAVTADVDLVTRIRNLAKEVEAGRPLTGLGGEFTEIFNRIKPKIN